jgi:tetratricopeptide (TPR) repeat protein
LEGHLTLINDFLDVEEMLFLLSACDAIVFPYQRSEESASGAVRLGLAAGRPVLTTPLPLFSDLSEIVYQLPGTEAWEIAEGILALLVDVDRKTDILRRQRDWVRANSWATQAARMSNIIHGCFEETRSVELRAPGSDFTPPRVAEVQLHDSSGLSREDDLVAATKFFERRATSRRDSARAVRSSAEIVDPSPPTAGSGSQETREGLSLLRGFSAWFISRADRARDTRDWVSAARHYRKALDQKPDNPPIWVQYGHALKESGNLGEAEDAYRKSLDLDEDVADTHLQLGHVLKIQGRKIEASAAYLRALTLDPDLKHASFELRGLGWTQGRIQLALRRERSGKN